MVNRYGGIPSAVHRCLLILSSVFYFTMKTGAVQWRTVYKSCTYVEHFFLIAQSLFFFTKTNAVQSNTLTPAHREILPEQPLFADVFGAANNA